MYAKTQILVCDDVLFLHAKGSIKQMRLIKEASSTRRIIVFYQYVCILTVYQKWLDPSKQWVQTLHLGKPIASISVSSVLNFNEVSPKRERMRSTNSLYSGESVFE